LPSGVLMASMTQTVAVDPTLMIYIIT